MDNFNMWVMLNIAVIVVIALAMLFRSWAAKLKKVDPPQPVVKTKEAPDLVIEAAPVPKPATPSPKTRATAKAKPAATPKSEKPPKAKPSSKPDNLLLLKGLGPKIASTLDDLGVTRFDQIASWTAEDVQRIDGQLGNFKGRIERDKWVEQAGLLAKGAIPEFEAKFGKLNSENT